NDADVADLVSFLREKCCWNSEDPPRNPRYHAAPKPTLDPAKGNLRGGPWGFVRSGGGAPAAALRGGVEGVSQGRPLEGIMAQLAGAELVWNLDGTAQEKRTFSYGCGSGCHTYGQILRNRFDEASWRAIVTKMTHNTGSLLLQEARPNRIPPDEQEIIIKWLT